VCNSLIFCNVSVAKLLVVPGDYARVNPEQVEEMKKKILHLPIKITQALAIRKQRNLDKSVSRFVYLQKMAYALATMYSSGVGSIPLLMNV